MPNYPTQQIQDELLNTIRKSQETVIDAIKTWVETVQSITPTSPSVQLPLTDELPKPQDVVAGAYDFAEKLLGRPAQVHRRGALARATSAADPGQRQQPLDPSE